MGAEKEGGMGKEVREDKEVGEVEREEKDYGKRSAPPTSAAGGHERTRDLERREKKNLKFAIPRGRAGRPDSLT